MKKRGGNAFYGQSGPGGPLFISRQIGRLKAEVTEYLYVITAKPST
jgi:hypothetical protein